MTTDLLCNNIDCIFSYGITASSSRRRKEREDMVTTTHEVKVEFKEKTVASTFKKNKAPVAFKKRKGAAQNMRTRDDNDDWKL